MNIPVITLAIAEDHLLYLEGLCNIIHSFDSFSITTTAPNGRVLIEAIERQVCLPDICILDINMPEMNGYETLIALKKKWPFIKVLVLSLHTDKYAVTSMLKNGANGFLTKNINSDKLQVALLAIYYHGYYYSDAASKDLYISVNKNASIIPDLTNRELEIVKLAGKGKTYEKIAEQISCSARTVQTHCNHIFAKLGLHSREELILFARDNGFC